MAKEKTPKTNAMRILDRLKISYEVLSYQCDEFIDGIHTADTLGIPHENCFKTLVLQGKSKGYSVFVLPIEEELNLKECAKAVNEKSVEMIHVRGCCTALGMKKEYPTIIHESALDCPYICVSAGKLGVQLKLSPQDFIKATGAKALNIIHE